MIKALSFIGDSILALIEALSFIGAVVLALVTAVGFFTIVLFTHNRGVLMKRKRDSGHGALVKGGRCVICGTNYRSQPLFKCTSSSSGRLCCRGCMEQWIYAQTQEVVGTAHHAKCFNTCGEKMELEDLQQLLTPKRYDAYCTALTRSYLSKDHRVVWCPCGTAFDTVCGRNLQPHWHQCQGCRNFVCLGCGEHSKEKDSRGRRKHKRRKECDQVNFGDAKRCPKCTGQIHRIQGCDVMRCTRCDTSFHYITGRLINVE